MFLKRRPRRKGLGALALGAAVLLSLACLLIAAAWSIDQPLAPAMLGGGGSLAGIFIGRWGMRELRLGDRHLRTHR
ncbi:MAG: hypothetical protein JSV80_02400 [Acidobacteriota bacterium]|nr:MAG: hypothetical protein JSV80_02400 [Acidobacteriota bacterium]